MQTKWQTVKTLIRLLPKEQSDLGLHCLLRLTSFSTSYFTVYRRYFMQRYSSALTHSSQNDLFRLVNAWDNVFILLISCLCQTILKPTYCGILNITVSERSITDKAYNKYFCRLRGYIRRSKFQMPGRLRCYISGSKFRAEMIPFSALYSRFRLNDHYITNVS